MTSLYYPPPGSVDPRSATVFSKRMKVLSVGERARGVNMAVVRSLATKSGACVAIWRFIVTKIGVSLTAG